MKLLYLKVMEHHITRDVCNIVYNYIHKYHHNEMMQELEDTIKEIQMAETYYEYWLEPFVLIRCIKCTIWTRVPWNVEIPEYNKYCERCIRVYNNK